MARLRRLAALALLAACGPVPAPALAPAPVAGPLVVAHRGASWDAPEHTLAAYDRALAAGADYLEQDLQLTRDGVLVVLHDETLDRTARGPAAACTGPVRARTLAELQACEVGSWFNARFPDRARPAYAAERIPTLDAVLARYRGRARFYVETKAPERAPGMEDSLVALLRRHGLRDARPAPDAAPPVLVQSFSLASLRRLRALDATLPLVLLIGAATPPAELPALLDSARALAVGVGPAQALATEAFVAAAHARCLAVHPYTVNDTTAMRTLVARGADGLFTDRPDVLRALLAGATIERRRVC